MARKSFRPIDRLRQLELTRVSSIATHDGFWALGRSRAAREVAS